MTPASCDLTSPGRPRPGSAGYTSQFRTDVEVPAAAVAPLAAVLRRYDHLCPPAGPGEAAPPPDHEVVAWALHAAEGCNLPRYELAPPRTPGGGLLLATEGYGTRDYDADLVEACFAAHGATGVVECLYEGETDKALTVLRGGAVERFHGFTVYPGHDPLGPSRILLGWLDPDQLRRVAAEASRAATQADPGMSAGTLPSPALRAALAAEDARLRAEIKQASPASPHTIDRLEAERLVYAAVLHALARVGFDTLGPDMIHASMLDVALHAEGESRREGTRAGIATVGRIMRRSP